MWGGLYGDLPPPSTGGGSGSDGGASPAKSLPKPKPKPKEAEVPKENKNISSTPEAPKVAPGSEDAHKKGESGSGVAGAVEAKATKTTPVVSTKAWSGAKFMMPVIRKPQQSLKPKPKAKAKPKAQSLETRNVVIESKKQTIDIKVTSVPSKNPQLEEKPINIDIKNEYDPFKPNEYERVLVMRERERKRAADERRRRRQEEEERARQEKEQKERKIQTAVTAKSGEEAWAARARLSAQAKTGEDAFKARAALSGGQRRRSRSRSPRSRSRSRSRSPRRRSRSPRRHSPSPPRLTKTQMRYQQSQAPELTRVVLLKNMVGPGEVDEDLCQETEEECSRFGPVEKCLVYESKGKNVSPHEAVRLFVKFVDIESAKKAQADLHNRFFGGRKIAASFFSEELFAQQNLQP